MMLHEKSYTAVRICMCDHVVLDALCKSMSCADFMHKAPTYAVIEHSNSTSGSKSQA